MNTKPNRDITAEIEHTKECIEFMAEDFRRDCICFMKPTTSTEEILKEFDRDAEEYSSPMWSRLKTPIRTALELYVNKALTTRTNELLGAMKMEKIGQNVILNCVSRNDYKKSYEYCGYNDAVEEFNKKLAALREKYGQR